MTKYSIDQFSNITGFSKFVLRQWENRYKFLVAERTDSNIRYYTDNLLVRAMNTRFLLENNVKISRIAEMSDEEIGIKTQSLAESSESTGRETIYIKDLLKATLEFDKYLFNSTYKKGVRLFGLYDFYKKVILPVMSKVGVLWLEKRLAPSQEHFLSELIKQKLHAEIDKLDFKKSSVTGNWLLFLPEGEFHEIGLLFSKFLIVERGFNVINLGQNLPYQTLLELENSSISENILFFCVSNESVINIDYTINFLLKHFPESKKHVVCTKSVSESLVKNDNLSYIHSTDEFLKILK